LQYYDELKYKKSFLLKYSFGKQVRNAKGGNKSKKPII